jgi:hypothetical protein
MAIFKEFLVPTFNTHNICISHYFLKECCYIQAGLFYARVKSNTKFSFKTVYFLGVRGLTASSYIVWDYTTNGHTDL